MSAKTRRWLLSACLWMIPGIAFNGVDAILHHGASPWWWLPLCAVAVLWNALLDWYVEADVEMSLASLDDEAKP